MAHRLRQSQSPPQRNGKTKKLARCKKNRLAPNCTLPEIGRDYREIPEKRQFSLYRRPTRNKEYTDKEGIKRYITHIIATQWKCSAASRKARTHKLQPKQEQAALTKTVSKTWTMTSHFDDYSDLDPKPQSRGYIHRGKYGTPEHCRTQTENDLCPKCKVRKKSVTKTSITKSICAQCAREYQNEFYASGRKKRCVARL